MNKPWLKSVFPIALIFSSRMLGLFMLIPVFTLFAHQLNGATPTLIGIALGSYGLSQGVLQIPFGLLSDKFGRKPLIALGLILFIIGSLLGAVTHSIYGMILARILQGTGAIGSVLIALLADLTLDKDRTKGMAVIGITIGVSFSLSMVISPAITHYFGLSGIFYLTAFLACGGLVLLYTLVPKPLQEQFHGTSEASPFMLKTVFFDLQLQRLNAGIFLQHFILTATFFAIPLLLQRHQTLGHLTEQWHFYLPLMLLSFLGMIPFIIVGEKKRIMKFIFLFAIVVCGFAQLLLAIASTSWFSLCACMLAYFIAFNILEASLPSFISKQAPAHCKGTAMGVYSSSQFLGIFSGGACAGILYQAAGHTAIFYMNAILFLLWLSLAFSMKQPKPTKTEIDSL